MSPAERTVRNAVVLLWATQVRTGTAPRRQSFPQYAIIQRQAATARGRLQQSRTGMLVSTVAFIFPRAGLTRAGLTRSSQAGPAACSRLIHFFNRGDLLRLSGKQPDKTVARSPRAAPLESNPSRPGANPAQSSGPA
jgi:hypothetical protein